MNREEREAAWLDLTRTRLPALAAERAWPVRLDHCFQRILLDNACGGRWYDHIEGRPAYRAAPLAILDRAIRLGEACIADDEDLAALDRRSLEWRGKA